VNYSFTGNRGSEDDSYYLNLQSGLNYGAWRLRNNGAWRYTQNNGQRHSEWQNIGTWARTVIPLKSELVLGDSNTGNDVFDSIGFRGGRLYSSDSMYPTACRATPRPCAVLPDASQSWCVRTATLSIKATFSLVLPLPILTRPPQAVTWSDGGRERRSQQRYRMPYSPLLLREKGAGNMILVAGDYRSGNSDQDTPFFTQGTLTGLANGFTCMAVRSWRHAIPRLAVGAGKTWVTGARYRSISLARSQLADDSKHEGQSLRFLRQIAQTASAPTSSCWATATPPKGFTRTMSPALNGGYQYADSQDDNDVPDVQSYHNLTWNKKAAFSSTSQSLGITARSISPGASRPTGGRTKRTSGISWVTRGREGDQLLRLVVVEQIRRDRRH
jgi:outer membrane usher protein